MTPMARIAFLWALTSFQISESRSLKNDHSLEENVKNPRSKIERKNGQAQERIRIERLEKKELKREVQQLQEQEREERQEFNRKRVLTIFISNNLTLRVSRRPISDF